MENTPIIQFKKRRELGAIMNDTFSFLRSNWKSFLGYVLRITIIPMFIAIAALVLYITTLSSMAESVAISGGGPQIGGAMLAVFLFFGSILLFYTTLYLSAYGYIKNYIDNQGTVNLSEINDFIKKNFMRFIGLTLLVGLIIGLASVFFLIPGVYLMIVFSISVPVMVFENKSVGDTISRCFELIKDNWWRSFGIIFVLVMVVGLMGIVFAIPVTVYQYVKIFTSINSSDPFNTLSIFKDPIYIVLMIISYVGRFLISSISLVGIGFLYFDLIEQKESAGALEVIDQLGQE